MALDKYCESLCEPDRPKREQKPIQNTIKPHQASEDLIMSDLSALQNLNIINFNHNLTCQSDLSMTSLKNVGFRKMYQIRCSNCNFIQTWNASMNMPDGKDFVTAKLLHGFFTSGMQKVHFERLAASTGIKHICSNLFIKYVEEYSQQVEAEKQSSCLLALSEELDNAEKANHVDIATDARHSTRKNSQFTDVVCVGYKTKKVIDNKVVSRGDDPCAQRHELIGTKTVYNSLQDKGVNVRRHVHDRNASINKYVREQQSSTTNQNDTWHVSVSVGKQLKAISAGAKCREGKTWSVQLADKVGPVKTHVQYAMRNCSGDKQKLVSMLENVVAHYENKHDNCLSSSRCKQDTNYIPSRQIITNSAAKQLLLSAIHSFDVYKHPENYIHAMGTFLVESFNNTLNVFHDKRIGTLGKKHYVMKTNLAVCHWNENVCAKKKNNSYSYRNNIWARWMSKVFTSELWRPF